MFLFYCSEFPSGFCIRACQICQVQLNTGRGALFIILLQAVHGKMSLHSPPGKLEEHGDQGGLILRGPVGILLQEVRRTPPMASHRSLSDYHDTVCIHQSVAS